MRANKFFLSLVFLSFFCTVDNLYAQSTNVDLQIISCKSVDNQESDLPKTISELTYVDAEMNGLLGMVSQYTFNAMAYFPSNSLAPHIGKSVAKLGIAISTNNATLYSVKVCIWTDTSQHGANPVYEQLVDNIQHGWQEIDLSTPYQIAADQPLFIGYKIHAKGNTMLCERFAASAEPNGYGDILQDATTGKLRHLHLLGLGDLGIKAYAGEPEAVDAAVVSVDVNATVPVGILSVKGQIKNVGADPITSYDVVYKLDGGQASSVYNVSGLHIAAGATHGFVHPQEAAIDTEGAHTVTVEISNVNAGGETNMQDNVMAKQVEAYMPLMADGFVEHFAPVPSTWTVVDNNGDDKTWFYRTGANVGHGDTTAFRSNYSKLHAADDYLVSPALQFNASHNPYQLAFWYRVGTSNGTPTGTAYPEKLKVYLATSPAPADTLMMITDLGVVDNPLYKFNASYFMQPQAGIYYLVFYTYSDKDRFYIAVDDIALSLYDGVEEVPETNPYQLYPNPCHGVLHIEGAAGSQLKVYDILGQECLQMPINAMQQPIDLSALPSGTYFATIVQANAQHTYKIFLL